MQAFRKILVAVEGERAPEGVLARAVRLAKHDGASIRLVAVVEDLPWYARLVLPTADDLQAMLVRDRTATLEEMAGRLRQQGLSASVGVLRGHRDLEVVREVMRGGHDLLMKEAASSEGASFGASDMHLLRTCPCPVWLMRPEQGDRPFRRVLAPVDPAPPPEDDPLGLKSDLDPKDPGLDARILDLAGALAEEDGAELHVLHAWSAPGEGRLLGNPMISADQIRRYVDDAREEARKAVDRLLVGRADPSGRRSVHLVKGDPPEVIASYAKTHAPDLIVMGTVARSGLSGLLIGNTAESILQRVGCSVLAVKPEGFVSPVRPAG